LESDVKAIRSAADKLIAKSDKLTKGVAALAVALMSLAHATDTGRGRIDELLDIAQSEASAAHWGTPL
ncbi:MAG: hypothetical protein WA662_13295, partial [Pseudolabrys sp.]